MRRAAEANFRSTAGALCPLTAVLAIIFAAALLPGAAAAGASDGRWTDYSPGAAWDRLQHQSQPPVSVAESSLLNGSEGASARGLRAAERKLAWAVPSARTVRIRLHSNTS